MRTIPLALALSACAVALTGCGGGSSSPDMAAPEPSAAMDFNVFVKSALNDSETAKPRDVNDVTFEFSDDPEAFNDVL